MNLLIYITLGLYSANIGLRIGLIRLALIILSFYDYIESVINQPYLLIDIVLYIILISLTLEILALQLNKEGKRIINNNK